MNKQLLLIKEKVLKLITNEHRRTIIEQRKLTTNDSKQLIMNLRSLMNDIILETNQDYYEEVINYEKYEELNKLNVSTMKLLYDFDIFTIND